MRLHHLHFSLSPSYFSHFILLYVLSSSSSRSSSLPYSNWFTVQNFFFESYLCSLFHYSQSTLILRIFYLAIYSLPIILFISRLFLTFRTSPSFFRPHILLYIFLLTICKALTSSADNVHISAPYVTAGVRNLLFSLILVCLDMRRASLGKFIWLEV